MTATSKRLLWVDDEIDLLRPHLLFVQGRGYHIDAVANGDDALELLRLHPYDLVLLDEQMPGRSGMEVFDELRRLDPLVPVVMVTKSEEDRTMTEAIGRRVADYLVKPTSPRQVLSVVTRLLEGESIQQQHVAREFTFRFRELNAMRGQERGWREWSETYSEIVDWELKLREAGETGLLASLDTLLDDFRREFCHFVVDNYPDWVGGESDRPPLSVDLVPRFLMPLLGSAPSVLFVIVDCLRLDQWRTILPILANFAEVIGGVGHDADGAANDVRVVPGGRLLKQLQNAFVTGAQLAFDRLPLLGRNGVHRAPDMAPIGARVIGVAHRVNHHVKVEGRVLDLGRQRGAFAADGDRGLFGADVREGFEEGRVLVEEDAFDVVKCLVEDDAQGLGYGMGA